MSKEPTKNQVNIARLRKERDRLRQKLASIEADYKKGLAPDSEDRAIELENADVLEGIARATAEELERIEENLSQLQ